MIAGRFDQEKVQTQLRYTGVLETTRIRQQVGSSVNLRVDVISFMRLTFLYLKLFRDIRRESRLQNSWKGTSVC